MIDKITLNGVDYPISGGGGAGVPTEVRQAMKALFEKAAYIETGLADEVAVVQAWASEVTAITISASAISVHGEITNQLSAVTTPAGGTVTWESSNTAVATVSNAGLVTGVSNGTAVITARSGDVSATCAVTVTGFATLVGIEAVYTQSGTVYDTASLDDLKTDLVVTGSYDDSTTAVVTDYVVLSGTLAVGTSTITVSYGGFTDTFTVTVTKYVKQYSFLTSVANWNYGAATNFTSRTTDGFVANSTSDSSWSAWIYQNNMVVTTDAVDGKTVRMRFDLELDDYSSGQGFIVGVAAWTSTNPTAGVQRDGYKTQTITESGSYDINIPVADTNLAISSSRYLGFYVNIHMNSSATVTLTNLQLTYY